MAEGRALAAEELTVLQLTGGQRTRQGISRQGMCNCVKIAHGSGAPSSMTCGDVDDDAEVLMRAFREITDILDRFEDDATVALATGHDEAYGHVISAGPSASGSARR